MNIPSDLKYTNEHEWVLLDGNTVTIGITDWAQGELGDIVFVELPEVDSELSQNEIFGTIEAVKAVSEMYAAVSGKVVEINAVLEDDPMVVNRDPYGEGWMIKVELSKPEQYEHLMDAVGYKNVVAE